MKILHTADWHIGAKTDDLDRFNEQKEALKQIVPEEFTYKDESIIDEESLNESEDSSEEFSFSDLF